jgi:hypothetical protein
MPLLVVAMMSAAACGDTTTPDPTTPDPVTDTFSGNLNQNGASPHSFVTAQSGQIVATIKTLSPDASLLIGFALGTWNGTACQIVLTNAKATQSTQLLGQASSAGSLCVMVYDTGNITDPVTYELTVQHP